MLIALEVDIGYVISRVLRWTAFACCALIVASFGMFARDQMAGASQHQQTELIAGAHPTTAPATPVKHAQPRRFIDSAAKVLTAPFDAVVESTNVWVKHGLPALFAVLVYGLGLGYLARFSSART
jgi:hypothetical protein